MACFINAVPAEAQRARGTTTETAASQLTPPYRISAGDDVEIYVWGEERLQRLVKVLPDGTFAFPLVGQINAQGKLPSELETMISERLKDQYRGQVPQVTVSVKNPTGTRFAVVGKVKAPGTYMPGYYATILDAITLAGGPAEFANMDSILVIRRNGDQQTTLKFRLSQLFKSGAGDDDLRRANVQRIESGDTIIVP
ncbi:polysaccharide biosynthesis/export family protein [Novosphingobium piscinae]|uniref:Polysaccharide export protein n=1 Tax=Novosphingobium piscinae TaxID=1507448 RepID=A0A7X1FXJ0_9SPHN|nr:polysaccharide biosynthesis/export family protein [Novosphingobium piscinae]MBC2668147.1 polysaccharide export protein [Novosphingobium piscinae]